MTNCTDTPATEASTLPPTGYHPSIAEALTDFEFEHLPCESLRAVAEQFHGVAHFLAATTPAKPRLTRALHRLSEARNLALRATLRDDASAPPLEFLPVRAAAEKPAGCCRERGEGTGPGVSAFV